MSATADFMASYLSYDTAADLYHVGPPVAGAAESNMQGMSSQSVYVVRSHIFYMMHFGREYEHAQFVKSKIVQSAGSLRGNRHMEMDTYQIEPTSFVKLALTHVHINYNNNDGCKV